MSHGIWILLGLVGLVATALLMGLAPMPAPQESGTATSGSQALAIPDSLNGWKRLDEETLAFKGQIREGTFQQMKAMFDDSIDTLVIASRGGRAEPAVRIGELVWQEKLDVIVERYCLSSCANYVFLASQPKVIRKGIVGFHGNITHSIRQAGGPEARAKQLAQRSPRTEEELTSWLRRTIEMEQSLMNKIGVSQEFYAMTASELSKPSQLNGQSAAFLLPTTSTFAEYGITDIRGAQSEAWKRKAERRLGVEMRLQ